MRTPTDRDETALHEAAAWNVRIHESELSGDECAAFEAWLDADPAHRAAYRRVETACGLVEDLDGSPEIARLCASGVNSARLASLVGAARSRIRMRAGVAAVVAAILLALLAGGLIVYRMPRTYEAGVGERRVVVLQDGSRMTLDASTVVRVRYDGSRRALWLDRGRAKFNVAHDPLRPFTVTAALRTVVATGTAFSVERLSQGVRVVLYEGRVAVLEQAPNGTERPIQVASGGDPESPLAPGQELIAGPTVGAVATRAPIDPVRASAWEGGQLVFDDEPMSVALARVNRYTASPVLIGDDVVAQMPVSGVFTAGDTRAFIVGVTTLLPVRARTVGADVELFVDPDRAPVGR